MPDGHPVLAYRDQVRAVISAAVVASGPNLPVDVIVRRLVNGISPCGRDLVLVIDDAHFPEAPEIGAVPDALLNFRMFLATRGSVPVKVATLRMRDRVVRLGEAGLQLASRAMPETADRAVFLRRFSGATGGIAGFLLRDVIGPLSTPVLDFLLRTSILDWFDADLAEAVSGQVDVPARLAEIEGVILFLVPLNAERTLFR